ncbi:MAG: putative membrane protein [Paracoccaceae bacterium]|jgi:uncharacterized membrane protein
MDTSQRSLLKAAIWQVAGLLVMIVIGYLYTGSLASGGTLAALNGGVGMVNYLVYERIWARISWGRTTQQISTVD